MLNEPEHIDCAVARLYLVSDGMWPEGVNIAKKKNEAKNADKLFHIFIYNDYRINTATGEDGALKIDYLLHAVNNFQR